MTAPERKAVTGFNEIQHSLSDSYKPILITIRVLMAMNFVFRVCLLIALNLMLSGCVIGTVLQVVSLIGGFPSYTTLYPKILCADKDSIGVGYYFDENSNNLDENSNNEASQLNESLQLISEHCAGEYIEAKRENHGSNSHRIYAICLQKDGTPSISQPCEYHPADENVGFGNTDPTIPGGSQNFY